MAYVPDTETCFQCGRGSSNLQRCSGCKYTFYCGTTCQTAAWPSHRRSCTAPSPSIPSSPPEAPVAGVRLLGGFNRPYAPRATTVPPEHPIWRTGSVSPVSQIVGVPLLILRDEAEYPLDYPNVAERDNQSVTYLMINPDTGFATARWQKNIGPVTVVRADQKPLTKVALEMIWMYCDDILERFGETRSPPRGQYNPRTFQAFCRQYKEDYLASGIRPEEIGAQELPL